MADGTANAPQDIAHSMGLHPNGFQETGAHQDGADENGDGQTSTEESSTDTDDHNGDPVPRLWDHEAFDQGDENGQNWVLDYDMENGRTYHAYSRGSYWGSNDTFAQDEELTCHELWFKTFGRHLICPYNRVLEQVLDLGTGTGLWASEIARQNPGAIVTGPQAWRNSRTCGVLPHIHIS